MVEHDHFKGLAVIGVAGAVDDQYRRTHRQTQRVGYVGGGPGGMDFVGSLCNAYTQSPLPHRICGFGVRAAR
ncbi:Uncharacterised protein [Mycobacterium tuberculosis]|nr:Uncharacterised protein [Mycobacterium tuberculosis]